MRLDASSLSPRRHPVPTRPTVTATALITGSFYALYVDPTGLAWGRVFGLQLAYSSDLGATHTAVYTFDETIQFMQLLANGEMIVSTGFGSTTDVRGELFVSTGFAADPATATWTKVLEASTIKDRFTNWGLHAWGQYVVAGEYGSKGSPTTSARRVWLSSDYGATFGVAFDLRDFYPAPDPFDNAHIHCAAIDQWRERIWVAHGDGAYQGIYWRALTGGSWTLVSSIWQPTTITATPTAVLFGTDDAHNGVLRWTEADGVVPSYLITPDAGSLTHIGQAAPRDPTTGAVYFGFSVAANTAGSKGLNTPIVATADDGLTYHELFLLLTSTGDQGIGIVTVPTASGVVLARGKSAVHTGEGATYAIPAPAWRSAVEVLPSGAVRAL